MARTMEDVHGSCGPLVEAIAKDCAANRREIGATNRRLDGTNRLLSHLACEVGNQREHLGVISGDLVDMKDVVESMNLRTIRLEAVQEETNGRLTGLESAQAETNGHLSALKTAQAEANGRLDRVDDRLNRVEATQTEHGNLLGRILAAVEKPSSPGA